jgi:hypothetical protein
MDAKLIALASSLAVAVAVAACASAADEAETTSGALSSGVVAQVATKSLRDAVPNCSIDVAYPVVTAPSADATAVLATNLPAPTVEQTCQNATAEHRLSISRGFKVVTNAHAILSLRFDEMDAFVGTGHIDNTVGSAAFDLRTGAPLGLHDLLEQGGLDMVRSSCRAQLSHADGASIPQTDIDGLCDGALSEDGSARPIFTLDVAGINLFVVLPAALHLGANVGVMIPWRTLRGTTKSVLADFLSL